jgi:integrase
VQGGAARPDLADVVSRWKGVERVELEGVGEVWRVPPHLGNLKAAKAMFRDALESGLVDTSPFVGLRLKASEGRRRVQPPSPATVATLVRQAREMHPEVPDIAAMIQVAAYSGLRLGELCGLRWEDIDFERSVLRVERQYRGRSRVDSQISAPKNGATRTIVLSPMAADALRGLPRHLDGFVFHTMRGRQMGSRMWQFYWDPVRRSVPETRRMPFHMLRHFYGTFLGDKGQTSRDIAYQLGHSDTRLVDRLYCHTIPENANQRVAALYGL